MLNAKNKNITKVTQTWLTVQQEWVNERKVIKLKKTDSEKCFSSCVDLEAIIKRKTLVGGT